jgi:hypothetical protein
MAKAILDARIYLAEVDLSCVSNAVALNLKTDVVDCTAFCDAYKDKLAGMTDVICDVSGFFSADAVTGNPDHKMFDQLALSNAVLTLCPEVGAFDTVAYFFRPTLSQYTPFEGKVGDMATFKLHGEGAAPLVKGKVMAAQAAKTITGAGTKVNLGAYSATQKLYAALHVFAASGTLPTLDAVIAIADRVDTITVHTAGTGYTAGQDLTIVQSGGSLATANIDTVDGGGGVTAVTLLTPGSGYAVANGLATTGGLGTGAKLNITAITDTTVLTFAQKTDVGFEWKTDDGPITDVNFKAKWTIGGTLPSFTLAIVAGIV